MPMATVTEGCGPSSSGRQVAAFVQPVNTEITKTANVNEKKLLSFQLRAKTYIPF